MIEIRKQKEKKNAKYNENITLEQTKDVRE